MSRINTKKICGWNLRSGGVVIGWVSAVLSLLQTVVCIIAIFNMCKIMTIVENKFHTNFMKLDEIRTAISMIFYVRFAFSILNGVTSVLMINGIRRNSQKLLLPWLVNNLIELVVKMIVIAIIFVKAYPLQGLLGLIIWGIQFCAWITIHLLYRTMIGDLYIYIF